MLSSFAFSALVGLLLYIALGRRIDSAVAQLRSEIQREDDSTLDEDNSSVEDTNPDHQKQHLEAAICKYANPDFPRYRIQDPYINAELMRNYERGDSRGRIRLLRRVFSQSACLPYQLALAAVTDSDSAVREWMARNARSLDYREIRYEGTGDEFKAIPAHPDRDLAERLKKDSDPFVRAALLENPIVSDFGFISSYWINAFNNCEPLERLAMMRNEKLDWELVTHILDPDDAVFSIETDQRRQLARACLVNKRVVESSRRSREHFRDYLDSKHSQTVWELSSKWPEDSGIQFLAFRSVQTEDSVKARVYSMCKSDALRETILESCTPDDKETIKLGRTDNDSTARFIAYGRSRSMDRQEIEAALRRGKDEKDKWVADALLRNPWVGSIARELNKKLTDEEKREPVT
jgi:hypothetical protein